LQLIISIDDNNAGAITEQLLPRKEVQAMWVIKMTKRMYAALKAWREMRREQLRQEFNALVEMTLAKSR
jgi:hypothetical protein